MGDVDLDPGVLVAVLLAGGVLGDDEDDGYADDEELLVVLELMAMTRKQQVLLLLLPLLPRGYTLGEYYVKPRRPSFYHSVAQKYWDDQEYVRHYRIGKRTFEELVDAIRADVQREDTNYRAAITAEQKLSCTLLYLATWVTMQQVSTLEGVGLTTVQRAVHEVSHALLQAFATAHISFPRTADEMVEAAAAFEQ